MGKGDRRSRRGKIYRGTFGKSRPKHTQKATAPGKTRSVAKPAATAKPAAAAKARPARKS